MPQQDKSPHPVLPKRGHAASTCRILWPLSIQSCSHLQGRRGAKETRLLPPPPPEGQAALFPKQPPINAHRHCSWTPRPTETAFC